MAARYFVLGFIPLNCREIRKHISSHLRFQYFAKTAFETMDFCNFVIIKNNLSLNR